MLTRKQNLENSEEDKSESKKSDNKTIDLIQKQISHELQNAQTYYQLAVLADFNGWPSLAKYLYEWSAEEREHSVRFSNFLLQKGVLPKLGTVEYEAADFDCICDIVENIYAVEKDTTEKIGKIYKTAFLESDFQAVELASSFMKEQLEEEQVALSLVKLWETSGASAIDFEMGMHSFTGHAKIGSLGEGKTFY